MLQTDRKANVPILQPRSLVRGMLISESASAYVSRLGRAFASATITVGGTLANLDQLRVVVNLPALPGGKVTLTVVLTGADTTTTAAQKIAKAINDSVDLRQYNCYANSAGAVVTFLWEGLLGNEVVLTQSVPVGSGTLTLGNSGLLAGGSGPIIPANNFNFVIRGLLVNFQAGKPVTVGSNVVKAMAAAGCPFE